MSITNELNKETANARLESIRDTMIGKSKNIKKLNKEQRRILALDFDHTLVHNDGSLSPPLIQAMKFAKKEGVEVRIVSARTILEVFKKVKSLLKLPETTTKTILKELDNISFEEALKKITKLGLPQPKISTLYDPYLDMDRCGLYYQEIDKACDYIKELSNSGMGGISPIINLIINYLEDQTNLNNNDDNPEIPEFVKTEKNIMSKLLSEQKSLPQGKTQQFKTIANDFIDITKRVDFILVDDSQLVLKEFGRNRLRDFGPIESGKLENNETGIDINVFPLEYKEVYSSDTIGYHEKMLDAIYQKISPVKEESAQVLSIDFDGTLFDTDINKTNFSPEIVTLMHTAKAKNIPIFINTNRLKINFYRKVKLLEHNENLSKDLLLEEIKNCSLSVPLKHLKEQGLDFTVVTPIDGIKGLETEYFNDIKKSEEEIIDYLENPEITIEDFWNFFNKKLLNDTPKIAMKDESFKGPQFRAIVEKLEQIPDNKNKNFEIIHIDDDKNLKKSISYKERIDNHKITLKFFNIENNAIKNSLSDVYKKTLSDISEKLNFKDHTDRIWQGAINNQNPFQSQNYDQDLPAFMYLLQNEKEKKNLLSLSKYFFEIHGKSLTDETLKFLRTTPLVNKEIFHLQKIFPLNNPLYVEVLELTIRLENYISLRQKELQSWCRFFHLSGQTKINAAKKMLKVLEVFLEKK